MNDNILVAIITGVFSLMGVLFANKTTFDKMSHELDKAVALLQQENRQMKEDIQEHNHYAKMFAESMPVVQEQIKVINHRLSDAENKIDKLNA